MSLHPANYAHAAKHWIESADLEGRELSPAERWSIERLLNAAEGKSGLGYELGAASTHVTPYSTTDPGSMFVKSEGFQRVRDSSTRGQRWSTGAVSVPLLGKGTLRYVVEGTADSGAAGVRESGLKPESDLAFSTVDEPIRQVATVIFTSRRLGGARLPGNLASHGGVDGGRAFRTTHVIHRIARRVCAKKKPASLTSRPEDP